MPEIPDPLALQIFDALRLRGIAPLTDHRQLVTSSEGLAETVRFGRAEVTIRLVDGGHYAISTTWQDVSTGERGKAKVASVDAAVQLSAAYLADPGALSQMREPGRADRNVRTRMVTLADYLPDSAEPDVSPHVMDEIKSWVLDCEWGDIEDPSDLDDFTDAEILKRVHRHYDGGLPEILRGMVIDGDFMEKPAISGERPALGSDAPELATDLDDPGPSHEL
jgi:hypothetical protein